MNFELKVQAPKNKPVIWNYQELRADLETALADYQNRVYTEDMLTEAKEDRAKLNKLKKAINDERIAREKEYMQPFNEFKAQAKELCDLIDTASAGISEQLDSFEEKRVAEKMESIRTTFNEVSSLYPINFIRLEMILNDKWLNKGTSDKAIAKEITEVFEKAIKDLDVIHKMPKCAFEAEEAYKVCLDLNKALEEGERMADVQEKKRQDLASEQYEAVGEEPIEFSFKVRITVTQARLLKEYCNEHKIKIEQI